MTQHKDSIRGRAGYQFELWSHIMGGVNQGIEAQQMWNLGIEAQKIWNLGTEEISGGLGPHNVHLHV